MNQEKARKKPEAKRSATLRRNFEAIPKKTLREQRISTSPARTEPQRLPSPGQGSFNEAAKAILANHKALVAEFRAESAQPRSPGPMPSGVDAIAGADANILLRCDPEESFIPTRDRTAIRGEVLPRQNADAIKGFGHYELCETSVEVGPYEIWEASTESARQMRRANDVN